MTEPDDVTGSGVDSVETPMGVAVLSSNPDDGPLRVRGVALSENDVTYGESGEPKFWPRDVVESSAEGLVGTKIVDDSEHEIPDGADIEDLPQQPSVDAIVGEVVDAKYEPGVGVVYEGEIDDPDVASLVENGRVDVSPFVFHQAAETEDDDVKQVVDIAHWRDLAVVSEGAGTQASIDPVEDDGLPESEISATDVQQPQSTAAAMSAAALSAVLDTSFDDSEGGPDAVSEENLDQDADADDDGDGDGDGDGDLEDDRDETDEAPEPEPEPEAEADAEEASESDADADDDADAEEPAANEPAESGADEDSATDIDMDLTEEEQKFVNKMRALDNPTVVESDVEGLAAEAEDLDIDQFEEPEVIESEEYEEPKVVEAEEYEDLSERVGIIEDFMAQRLAEKTGMKEETAGALSLDAMFREFETEDGEFDAEALVQDPVSGDSGGDTSSPDEEDAEALQQNEEEKEELEMELEALRKKRDVLGNTSIAGRIDEKIEKVESKMEGI